MANAYIRAKAAETAKTIAQRHGIEYGVALKITLRLWAEARASIMRLIGDMGKENWDKLSAADKAAVCGVVVKELLNRKKLCGFLSGEKRGLV
jgi:hypothetical protein